MKKYICLFLAITGILSFNSCDKWLEVTPRGQVEASDLLDDTEGFCSALSGIYYTLMQPGLYGKDMTYGFIDALAQYWKTPSKTHHLYPATQYDYENGYSQTPINNFWSKFYQIIAQCNQLEEALNAVSPDAIDHYSLMKGEILGLRAFAHLQLLELFGPSIRETSDLEKPGIAYRTTFDPVARKFNTVKEVLQYAKSDLLAALELLREDPVKVNGRTGDGNTSALNYLDVLDRRGSRMNYFAVLALLAREEQLALNKTETYRYAKQLLDEIEVTVINSYPIFHFTPKDNIGGTSNAFRDITFSDEMIFSVYVTNLYDITGPIFGFEGYDLDNNNYWSVDFGNVTNYIYGRTPDGSGADYRLNYWFIKNPNYTNLYSYKKYQQAPPFNGASVAYAPEISIIRLPEIYYMMCESLIGNDNGEALKYLNTVRESRNLQPLKGNFSNEDLMTYLIREERKEFFGEGRMFFVYKRLNAAIEVSQGVTIAPQESIFKLPIPNEEYEFSPNEKK